MKVQDPTPSQSVCAGSEAADANTVSVFAVSVLIAVSITVLAAMFVPLTSSRSK